MTRGQMIVELALVAPLLFTIILGSAEMGMLYATRAEQASDTVTLADFAAAYPDEWQAAAAALLPGCATAVTVDGLGITEATATCEYVPRITSNVWSGLPISTAATAYVEPEATP